MDSIEKAVNTDSVSVEQTTENKEVTTNQNVIPTLEEALGNGEVPQLPADYMNYSPLAKLAIQGSLMIMEGKYGGGFFVKFIQDVGTAYGWLNLIIVYPDGDYKAIQLYKTECKETDTESSNGVSVLNSETVTKGTSKKKDAKGYARVDWKGEDLEGYPNTEKVNPLDAYTTPKMPIPTRELWKKILDHYKDIPIVKISQTASIEKLLEDIQVCAEEDAKAYGNGFVNGEKEWYIQASRFREIVENNGWNLSRARTEFDLLGLFVKDNVAHSYQKVKRVGNDLKRFYVIRKTVIESSTPPKMLDDVEFTRNYKTTEERKIATLEWKVKDCIKKYNILAEKTGDPPMM